METIEVTARWDEDGQVSPLQFRWKGTILHVEAIGRRWQDEAGLHALVKAMEGRTFELVFKPDEMKWFLGYQDQSPARV
jgi:hypothetical protein